MQVRHHLVCQFEPVVGVRRRALRCGGFLGRNGALIGLHGGERGFFLSLAAFFCVSLCALELGGFLGVVSGFDRGCGSLLLREGVGDAGGFFLAHLGEALASFRRVHHFGLVFGVGLFHCALGG